MEIRENRNKKKIAVIFLVLIVVELVCMYLFTGRNIRVVRESGKNNYQNTEWNDYSAFELNDCEDKGDYLEITGENPEIVLKNVHGYVDAVQIAAALSMTYCGKAELWYDNGNGYQRGSDAELNQENFTIVLKKDVKKLKIVFQDIHENQAGPSTLAIIGIQLNPLDVYSAREQLKDYLMASIAVMAVTGVFLSVVLMKKSVNVYRIVELAVVIFALRLLTGSGYIRNIPYAAKVLTVLFNCAVAAFAILLITKKDVEDEESND